MADDAQSRQPGGGGSVSLAARYRPQTFAQVVGQEMVKSILSRAALEDRVAPAYLLSGTRGVGKTTVARIFAKALNCVHAPTGEPCNECGICRRITQGSFVDVVEIDGASNRGIDDVRRLRDAVGYAPLEGRYKVFIIDEAHMLTKEAFNALLKTLEEPPAHVTFIMATTEQHKFPVTIVSRCQHFVFRQIPEATLEAHIRSVLEREARPFEDDAARLIARRAAGSVRDAMSLLGQTLALGGEGAGTALSAAQAREVLGLAGQEVMDRLLDALAAQDALAVARLVRELLGQGADMGFFLRELGSLWRNLFLVRQAGPQAAVELELPERESSRLVGLANNFSLSYIHAAWQMTLESQRRILTSLEPAAGLELLLLNLALLPRLLPLGDLNPGALAGGVAGGDSSACSVARNTEVSAVASSGGDGAPRRESGGQATPGEDAGPARTFAKGAASPVSSAGHSAEASTGHFSAVGSDIVPAASAPNNPVEAEPTPLPRRFRPPQDARRFVPPVSVPESASPARAASRREAADDVPPWLDEIPAGGDPSLKEPDAVDLQAAMSREGDTSALSTGGGAASEITTAPEAASAMRGMWPERPGVFPAKEEGGGDSSLKWEDFLTFCEGREGVHLNLLRQCSGEVRGERLRLRPQSQIVSLQLQRNAEMVKKVAQAWAGRPLEPQFLPPSTERRTTAELKAEMQDHPVVRELGHIFGATLVHCAQVDKN